MILSALLIFKVTFKVKWKGEMKHLWILLYMQNCVLMSSVWSFSIFIIKLCTIIVKNEVVCSCKCQGHGSKVNEKGRIQWFVDYARTPTIVMLSLVQIMDIQLHLKNGPVWKLHHGNDNVYCLPKLKHLFWKNSTVNF